MQDSLAFLGFVAAVVTVGVVGGNLLVELWDRHRRDNRWRELVQNHRDEWDNLHLDLETTRQRQEEEFREFCRNPTGDPVFEGVVWFKVDRHTFRVHGIKDMAEREGCEVLWGEDVIFIGKRTDSLTKSTSKKL